MSSLRLYNTLTRSKEDFIPFDDKNVRMYVCGPTVYDFAHIGNARPVIVFDVLYRLLRHLYGPGHVTYVRNITDVDDKINARAIRDFPDLPLNDAIRRVTETTANQFMADTKSLGCLEPNVQPRATDNIAEMIAIIETLVKKGNAYVADGEVLFEVGTMPEYGALSRRAQEDQKAGARVAVEAHKRNPADFVLWKLSSEREPGWESPWGRGRPGWHIECSAMSNRYLGETFDIHGGGLDLIFPHHENEIAQSRCAFGHGVMARTWMHNGFLQVEGEKMSKSLGNFVTINELLTNWKGYGWPGDALRFNMLTTHYRQPIDWTSEGLDESHRTLFNWYEQIAKSDSLESSVSNEMVAALCDDLNTHKAISILHALEKKRDFATLKASLTLMGFSCDKAKIVRTRASSIAVSAKGAAGLVGGYVGFNTVGVAATGAAGELAAKQVGIQGVSARAEVGNVGPQFSRISNDKDHIDSLISARIAARNAKNWAESDRIRDELVAMGIQIQDSKDPITGELKTVWEVKR